MAYRKSLDFLPSVFQTNTNEKLLRATVDQLVSEPETKQLNGYIGRKFNPALTPGDSYIFEDFADRQNYQLEPTVIYADTAGDVKFVSGYVDLLNRINNFGGNISDPSRLFAAEQYSYSGLFDFDKFVNYSSYYWLPNGPDEVNVFATEIPVDQDIDVFSPSIYAVVDGKFDSEKLDSQGFDVSGNDISRLSNTGYTFSTTGNRVNPVIRLARGGTYRFNVDQSGHGFFIQSLPGNTTNYPWQNNLSIREVFGVENNGEDAGTVVFNVPKRDQQDFFVTMNYQDSVNLVAYSFRKRRRLRYTEVQNARYSDFLNEHVGIDGQRAIDGKSILFLPSKSQNRVPQPWMPNTLYQEADLVIYANTVYRVMADYRSGRFFTTGNLEIYDLEDHWYNPALFDNTDVGFDFENFDRGDAVPDQQKLGWFRVSINDEGYINLTPDETLDLNKRVFIGEGVEFGNREIYRSSSDQLELIPPLTANLDLLYYQDALDPNINGIIELVDQDNNLEIAVDTILSLPEYTSPNGVTFENGLKVKFVGNTNPVSYEGKTYYVEGVGEKITLIDVETLETPESWLETTSTPFDAKPFDSQSFDQSQPAPISKQYIGIKRSSQEGSAWTRQNRWFHENVIRNTNFYNGFTAELDQTSRAKRPIIEFDSNIQLYNFGRKFKTSVTVIDNREIDALSNVEGLAVETVDQAVSGYYSDGIPLVNGNRVIFANDASERVRETIWKVEWITPESNLNNRTVDFTGDGATVSFDLNFEVTNPIRLSVLVNGVAAEDAGFLWSLSGQNIVFESAPGDGVDVTVNYTFTQQIHLVPVDTAVEGDVVLSTLGNTNQGTNWRYDGTNWIKSQSKTENNQAPLFDLFDKDGNSIGDQQVYVGSNFAGNKIFGYKIGNTVRDSELGLRLAYRNIGNVGDILFVDHITDDQFSYESVTESSVVKSTAGYEIAKNLVNGEREYANQWVKLKNKTKQYQTETFFATQYQKNNFKLNIRPAALGPDNILVYKNNVPLTSNEFDVEIIDSIGYLTLAVNVEVDDKIDVKVYSQNRNSQSVWEIPSNLENNAKNQDIAEITLGQMRNHILEAFVNTPEFVGAYQGNNNVKDLSNIKINGGKIVQNAGAPHLANLFLNDAKANFVEGVLYSQREYANFKNRFQRLSAELNIKNPDNAVDSVDQILTEISQNKSQLFPYYHSDMVPAGSDYTKSVYTVDNTAIDSYYLNQTFDINTASGRAVLVYLNGEQLTYGLDYTFGDGQPVVRLNIAPERPEKNKYYLNINLGDVIEIREYASTNGFHVPQTPTKLGLYPAYRPKILLDGYSGNTNAVIRGHDGSLTVAYGDYRDQLILELEKRIYNNIKSRYDGALFDIASIIPGAFRRTDYSKTEFENVLSSNFSSWLGKNNLQVNDALLYDSNDPFTWNYSQYADIITRSEMPAAYWRGLYRYFYDTDQPHTRPWEMLGFAEEPEWWSVEYGPAPYTSGNSVLWDDLELGRIRQGARAGVDGKYARPGLKSIIPVDDGGRLLSPFECLALNTSITTSGKYIFGDGSPVETAWRQSSDYPFAIQLVAALTKPAEYFGLFRDTLDQTRRFQSSETDSQWEFVSTNVRSKSEYVHGEVVDGVLARTYGYTTWISEYATSLGLSITEEVGEKLRNIDLRLSYKLGGYTDKKYIKLYADQSSPDSVNSSVLIPDNNYQIKLVKSSPRLSATYSGVIVTRSGTGFSVRGYDDSKPYFVAETGKNSGESFIIQSGTDAVTVARYGSGRFVTVPYGTEFLDKSQVVEFLVGLGRYQQRQGFRFDRKVEGTSDKHDWTLAAKEFLFWTQQAWDEDVAIALSPIGSEIDFRSSRGTVDAITNRPYGSRILNTNFEIIDAKKYTVNRNGRNFSLVTNDNSGIYLADVDVVDYEHVIVLDNVTQFNDIIYQPALGNRQYRIKIVGFKTGAWDGTFGAAGYIINDNNIQSWKPGKNYYKGEIVTYKDIYYVALRNVEGSTVFDTASWGETEYDQIDSTLLPNLSNRAGLPKSFYDFNSSNLEIDADRLAKSLIGFTPRSYLENLSISDTSQVKFYQGLVGQKGSNNSLDKMLRAKLDNFDGSAEFFEQWAIRDGYYGADGNTNEIRIPLKKSTETSKNPTVIELLDPNDSETAGRVSVRSKDLLTYPRPYNKNFLSYRNSKSEVNDLPNAGFAKLDEVDYISPTVGRIGDVIDRNVTDGSRVWVGQNSLDDWNIYRFTDINVPIDAVTIDSLGTATVETKVPHGLVLNQRIYTKAYDVRGFSGLYQITRIIDDKKFSMRTNFARLNRSPINSRIYTLVELKNPTIDEVVSITPVNGWRTGDQFYIENATDIGWGVYEKTDRYTTISRYSDSNTVTGDGLGVSVASSISNDYLLAGSSASNTVETYKKLRTGALVEDVEIANPSTGLADFGAVISASSADYAAVGSPASGGNTGYVHILRRDTTGSFIIDQAIAPAGIPGGEFGAAIALSDDARWLYVGQPEYLEGYVWVYQLIQADTSVTQRFLGNGVDVNFVLTGEAAAASTNIYSLKIANKDGKIMIPFRDYIFNSSTKTITFTVAPPLGEINVFFRSYYNLVLAATLASEIGDRFAASLATSTDGGQVIIGAPGTDNDSAGFTDTGAVYVVDRTVEKQFADGVAVNYSTALTVNGAPLVTVDDDVKIQGVDYVFDGVDTVTFVNAPPNGSIISIDSNNPVLSQIITESTASDSSSLNSEAEFGYSLDLCPTNCSLYIGSPFDNDNAIEGGRVYRFINQGRFYGVDAGTTVDPVIGDPTIISINDFLVSFSGGENLSEIVNKINDANIPGIIALSENNVLTLETNREVFADKLNLVQISGNFLDDVGMRVYESQQAIDSPRDRNFNNFGKVVKVSTDALSLAVGTDVGDTVLRTTFDGATTVFDSRTTEFFANKKQSGSVFIYQLISKPNATVNDPSRFIYAEQLTANDIEEFDQFGASIDFSNNTVYVGAPGNDYQSNGNSGLVYGFTNNSNAKTWELIRSENPKVDLSLINRAYIYDTESGEKLADLDIIDPAKGYVSGIAQQEITYQSSVDPAFYNNNSNASKGITWGRDHVGEIWWDTSQTRWVEYEQDSVEYRAANWGFSFPGSRIICAEWTESDVPPANFVDPTGNGAFPLSTTQFNVFSEYNENTGGFTTKYYFWVAAKTTPPANVKNRSISATQIEDIISNPKLNGVPYAAFLDTNSIGLYNVDSLLTDNTVLVIDYDVKKNNNVIHSEYELIGENDANSVPSNNVLTKMIDSLAGQDSAGNLVPDVTLNDYEKLGTAFRPRQSMFVDRTQAVRESVAFVNDFLRDIPAVYSKDISSLTATEPLPDSTQYNEAVENRVELDYLNISLFGVGYLVLVKQDETTRNRWVVYAKTADNTWQKHRVQSYNNNRYLERITWTDPNVDVPDTVDTVVDFEFNLRGLTASEGEFVKIRDNGEGLFKVVMRSNGEWKTVQEENGTVQLTQSLWKTSNNLQGWDRDGFGLQLFDDWPSTEIQNIFRAVYNDIFSDEDAVQRNRWFLHMIKYAISEVKYSDWALKTSFIKVNQTQRALQQIPVYQRDNQDLIRQYIEEVKPYHTKILEFVLQYSSDDVANLDTTDFDLPAYYNFATGTYRSPTGSTVEDQIILNLSPYTDWVNNHTLELGSVDIYYGGSGYITPPRISLVGGGGVGATAEAVVSSGTIVDVRITNPGSGYTGTPVIVLDQVSFDPAILSPRMINSKVRSFDTTIKFDRVSTTAGWLVHFKDASGNPVDVRNERISRVSGSQGVIDEVLNLFSINQWIVDTPDLDVYPVDNVPNYRVFDDASGRVQFFDRRDTRGWTPQLLQQFIAALGSAVGANLLDIRGTTVVEDGSLASFAPSVLPWTPGFTYYPGDIVVNGYKLYTVSVAFIAPTQFNSTFLEEYSGADLHSHIDRTWAFYQPQDGMPGRDLTQLFDNVVFPGVNVIGANFNQNPGFDVGLFDSAGYDNSVIGPEGVPVINPSILDQTLYSDFVDTSLGTKPEDIITQGGDFVDVYHSHAPEEMIPGRVYDTLDIKVHTLATGNSDNGGFGIDWSTHSYITDGVTAEFGIGDQQLGDHFLVYLKNGGPRYRAVTDSGQGTPSVVPPGSFYDVNQDRSYTVDYTNNQIVFSTPPAADDVLQIYNVKSQGENIILDQVLLGDGVQTAFSVTAEFGYIADTMILINGAETQDYSLSEDSQDANQTVIEFGTAPAEDAHIHVIFSGDFDRNSIGKPYTQIEMVDNTDRIVLLDEEIRFDRSKDTVLIVELNGDRLTPGNTNYYTGDGSTSVFLLPSSAGEDYNSLTFAEVQVWKDGVRQDATEYVLSEADGSSIPTVTFFETPELGSDVSVTYTANADYFYDTDANTIRINENLNLAEGSLVAITSFSAHDLYKIKTKVFVGSEQLITPVTVVPGFDESGFDAAEFDTENSISVLDLVYPIDSNQNDADKVIVTINGAKQFANRDYVVQNGNVILADSITITDETVIVITWSSPNQYRSGSTFQIFKDMNDVVSYHRLADSESTQLAKPLTLTDTEIEVTDAARLAEPDPEKSLPGVIFVDGERITYYTKTNNRLGQIRRGTSGTGARDVHAAGSVVIDASTRTAIPNAANGVWYAPGTASAADGQGLQTADTVPAKFITEKKGLLGF